MTSDDATFGSPDLEQLDLPALEEAIGEIHRRIGVALRALGEQAADQPDPDGRTPRRQVAELVASLELAALTVAASHAGSPLEAQRIDRHPALAAGLMYAAPALPSLLQRLEQDRRLLVSLVRGSDERLDDEQPTPWGPRTVRRLLVEVGLGASARCAVALEQRAQQARA